MPRRIDLDEKRVVDLYTKERLNTTEISKTFNVSHTKIINVLKNNKIKRRDGLEVDKDRVIDLYINENRSARYISKLFNCSRTPILKILRDNNLKIIKKWTDKPTPIKGKTYEEFYGKERAREMKIQQSRKLKGHKVSLLTIKKIREKNTIKLDLNLIKNLYLSEEKSCEDIAKELGVNTSTIWNRLNKLNIPIRKNKTERSKSKNRQARMNQIFPSKDTKIEVKIQDFLKLSHIEFLTHYHISEITHSYQCDILIPKQETEGVIIPQKTIIECDGCYWHGCPKCKLKIDNAQIKQIEEDKVRTKELQEKGYRVIRLWEHDIKKMELNDFEKKIKNG